MGELSTGPSAHATLGPSSAARWLTCPGSVRLAAAMPERPAGEAAEEGTAAHALAEIRLRDYVLGEAVDGQIDAWAAEYGERYDIAEMSEAVAPYVQAVEQALAQAGPDAVLLLEQRHSTGIPGVWGTADSVVMAPGSLHVLDLKFGRGVRVAAAGNPQLRLYALGALRGLEGLLDDSVITEVTMTIVQPRLGARSDETVGRLELERWAGWAQARAEMTEGPQAPLRPSESACRWCPAAGACEALRDHSLRAAFGNGEEPTTIDPWETPDLGQRVADSLAQVPLVEQWARSVKSLADDLAQADALPGYHLEPGRSRRKVVDSDRLIKVLTQGGYEVDQITSRDVLGITALTKVVGRSTLDALTGEGLPIESVAGPDKLVKNKN